MIVALLGSKLYSQPAPKWHDPSPHKVQFITVDGNISLEVLDWGGSGRPLVLLAGLGNTAHVFDEFALKLTADYHVYGITRRGFGESSIPPSGYEADRLGDDVLAVLDSLKLDRPVLVGHSAGGEELSSVATRRPNRVAALVYLDAGYPYAFDDGNGSTLDQLQKAPPPQPPPASAADRASFSAYRAWFLRGNGITFPEAEFRQGTESTADGRVGEPRQTPAGGAIMAGIRKYAAIRAPALVVFAVPHALGTWVEKTADPMVREQARAFSIAEMALVEKQARAFENGVPGSRVVRLPHAHHYVFLSNEADVLREMRAFLASLP